MPGFKYQAYADDGKLNSGVLEADSARAARAQLRSMGLTPYKVDAIEDDARQTLWPGQGGRLTRLELMRFTRGLASLTDAGLTLEQSFNALIEQAESARERNLIAGLRSDVMAGSTLARAMAARPATFDELYRTLVAAGESAGQLPRVMARMADHLEDRANLTGKVAVALIYPTLVLVVSLVIIIALMTYVVPQVVTVFANTRTQLPAITQTLIAVSTFLKSYGIVLLALTGVGLVVLTALWRQPDPRAALQRVWLRVPVVGRLARALDSARLASTLAILTGSGVPLLTSLQAAGGVLRMAPLRAALKRATESVQAGASLAQALRETQAFPPVLAHLISSGEATGKLDAALDRAAREQESEAMQRIHALTAMVEPAIILFVGLVVLVIVLAVLLPIFELNRLVVR